MAIRQERKRLGEILIAGGALTEEQLIEALKLQKSLGSRLGEVLVRQNFVPEEDILRTIQKQLGLPSVDLNRIVVTENILKMIPEAVARKYTVLPVEFSNGQLLVASSDPTDYYALDDIRLASGVMIKSCVAKKVDILRAIDRFYGRSEAVKAVSDFVKQTGYDQVAATSQVSVLATVHSGVEAADEETTPIIKFLNTIIENAVNNFASDIHIEPVDDELRVRFRIDGVLREIMRTPVGMAGPVVSRVKIMADMNIAERRLPQDGRITYLVGKKMIDLRVSTAPTMYGEKVVLRILDKSSVILEKSALGIHGDDLESFDELIAKPYGIVLVTGPTGSGKTTTLYTALNQLNTPEKNIITLEDPVEYNFKGVNQIQVNPKAGLTFARGLRSILRQDPDIIMVGEMRDNETAEIAVRSALTGHLVLSTIHTNDAPSAVTRLVDMDIEPFLISASVVGIISQRLVRKICPNCSQEYPAEPKDYALLGRSQDEPLLLKRGGGCTYCHESGYKGRTAIFEIMPISRGHRNLIDKGATADELRAYAVEQGMTTLKMSAVDLVISGVTTIEELLRVTYVNE
ncbi:type II secretory pathway, ATPase PulE/Tfp pilus assembly pathway, ATPase PilB [Desulfitobacterium dichloroeliminans LMG P-21439]|uniref:Type II secretory pathway, ATPase PulE/Tfp pilus assembly pathway, ATPase PilB n=1 Tax=Desulfitobacterium dichloroeliminans (strain LMG P-21439 / DCA1) TaxID=871963 RepID=L0F7T4_DESDL|nr:ATPase, T2SS/T4P/T4SS family [Desulfitobacterium dichloroeliminans]AGA69899.1 type II secretory pathway, ATPase PulE/Tfp pilus assembly pathway, ATPase PilB [Desulfitobacterium dichloroeliminans LMG P-21439]